MTSTPSSPSSATIRITRLGLDSVRLASELDSAIHALQIALERTGSSSKARGALAACTPTSMGWQDLPTWLPSTVFGGELRALSGRRVAVVGVKQVGDYDAVSTAQALKELHNIDAVPEEVSIPDLPIAASLTDLYGRRLRSSPQPLDGHRVPARVPNLPQDGFELLSAPPSPHGGDAAGDSRSHAEG